MPRFPSYFITCFDEKQLPMYRQAIDIFAETNPQHSFDIDTSGVWNSLRNPAFLCFNLDDLPAWWKIFESIRRESKA